jgi:hypothetical protein
LFVPTWVLALAIAAGIGLGVLGWRALRAGDGEPAARTEEVATAAPPATREVVIRVESTPAGALVSWNGEARGRTPLAVSVLRTIEPAELELALDGHETLREHVVPDVDQRLRLSLRADAPTDPPVAAAGEEARDETPEPRPRSRTRARMTPATMMTSGFQRWD